MRGGYKLINLHDMEISAEGVVIPGIHAALEDNYRKALLITGIVIDKVEKPDTYTEVSVADGSFTFLVYGKTITVTSEDKVMIA